MTTHTKVLGLAIALTTTLGVSGCATNQPAFSSGNVAYGDTKAVESLTNEIGLTDFQMMAEKMTTSLLTSPLIAGSRQKPTITISDIKNKTSEHIDTRAIALKIRTQLSKSQTVRLMGDKVDETHALTELQRQGQSGRYKASKSVKMGNAEGAKYSLYGEITSIVKRADDIKNIDYILNLTLEDLDSSEIVWTEEKEIRKTSERPLF
ncbi:MAG: penicillin-binding protein activator LpoB [Methylococcaceae bacterium]|nr:penicillin-binding protein activator LpoB [Methylococcaceae bacterium]